MSEPKLLFEGKHLRVLERSGWEYVERPKVTGIVAIIAVTDDGRIVLIEQHREPFNASVIELPAGLAGDSGEVEDVLTASHRELLEETGYEARGMEVVGAGAPSAGLSNELVTLVRASGLKRTASGGGVEGERITVHEIPVAALRAWLADQLGQGKLLDLKIYGALAFLPDA